MWGPGERTPGSSQGDAAPGATLSLLRKWPDVISSSADPEKLAECLLHDLLIFNTSDNQSLNHWALPQPRVKANRRALWTA